MKFSLSSLPSLHSLTRQFFGILRRFPLALLFACLGTFAALEISYSLPEAAQSFWVKILICSHLGMVFSIALSTFAEAGTPARGKGTGLQIILVLALAGYWFSLHSPMNRGDWYRFALLAATAHLLVSILPFSTKGQVSAFWHYNKDLFLRFLTAVLYSGVLFAGICIALLALRELFSLEIRDEVFLRLWILIAGLFNTSIFLAGIPHPPAAAGEEVRYPRGLKIFTQFVLIPLVSLYILILLAYELKIILQWHLPSGWVANLVIAFAVFGILSLLLVFPVRHEEGNRWIVLYNKLFYWIMIPLLALLMVAIGVRIYHYGLTEERYWVAITGIWLLFLALYFIPGHRENIKVIPSSLLIAVLAARCSMTPLCRYSQQSRLEKILRQQGLAKNGKVLPQKQQPGTRTAAEITSIIGYLYEVHGVAAVQPYFSADLQHVTDLSPYAFADSALRTVGMHAAVFMDSPPVNKNRYFNLSRPSTSAFSAEHMNYWLEGLQLNNDRTDSMAWQLGTDRLTAVFSSSANSQTLRLALNGGHPAKLSMDSLIMGIITNRPSDDDLRPGEGVVDIKGDGFYARLIVTHLRGIVNDSTGHFIDLNVEMAALLRLGSEAPPAGNHVP